MNTLKIITYNIHNGKETEALTKNVQKFSEQGVALFCLQEFWKWMQPTDLEPILLETLGSDWGIELRTPDYPKHDWGTCLLWNKKVLEATSLKHVALPLLPQTSWWERWWIRRSGYGPEAFIPQRGALIGTFRWNNNLLRVTNVHLDWEGGLEQRKSQLEFVRDYLAKSPVIKHGLICGDFNVIGFNKTKQPKALGEVLGKDFKNACAVPEVTCPPFFNPDQIFVKNMKVLDYKVHRVAGSDHFPILIELARDA